MTKPKPKTKASAGHPQWVACHDTLVCAGAKQIQKWCVREGDAKGPLIAVMLTKDVAHLFAAAPDHALVAAAFAAGICRFEKWGNPDAGELCFGGLRYATDLDEFGVPKLTGMIRFDLRVALTRATGAAS